MQLSKKQRYILTIYYGYAYSMERDLSTEKMEEKAIKFIKKYGSELNQNGGGYALMMMEKALEGNGNDESRKRAMLAVAIGFEMTCCMVKLWPSFMLPICRFMLAPPCKDIGFRTWTKKNEELINYGISLLVGLENFSNEIHPWEIIFNTK